MTEGSRPISSVPLLHRRFECAGLVRLGATLRLLMAQRTGQDADQWLRGVLHSVRDLTEADKAALFVWAPGRVPTGYGDGLSQEAVTAYLRRFASLVFGRQALGYDADVWTVTDLWPREQLPHTEFYRAFVHPFRLHDMVGLSLRLQSGRAELQLAVFEEHSAPAALIRWRQDLLRAILPPFRVAMEAWLAADDSSADFGSLIDVSGQALMLFDLSGRALHSNPVMRRLLAQDRERNQVESHMRQVARAVLMALEANRVASRDKHADGRRREIATSMAAYRLRGNPVGQNALGHPRAVLVSVDRVSSQIPAADSLRIRYGLTVRELQVASLILHRLSNNEIARMLDISPHTARHHTENVLAKLGVRSRNELRRLVAGGDIAAIE